ncbi:protein MpKAI2A [Marchantia polymorpha subsp. ruderalis]|nr:hypothetical protein MARPO_0023s0138 [Marchantia polymorpha]BBN01977.1 hypothetical protein Mp_2g11720 [Marchantia polymorpha subsp. ruderalis]|eukprot:PTQ43839.1 hypothetical protein MARPO_0023s0138 [Marchantia polymorpha]
MFSHSDEVMLNVKRCRCDVSRFESVADCFTSSNKSMGTSISVANGTFPEQSEGRQTYLSGTESRIEHGDVDGAYCAGIADRTRIPSSSPSVLEGERTDSTERFAKQGRGAQTSICGSPPCVDGDGQVSALSKPVTSTSFDGVSKKTPNLISQGSVGAAATILGIPPGGYAGQFKTQLSFGDRGGNEHSHLPHSVLQVIATSLQCDLVVAAILQNPLRLAETVLCVPKGLVTVPLRFSKSALAASTRCEVLNTDSLLLPSMLTAVLGARPKRFLATQFHAEGYEGLCYSLWLDPDKVPDVAESVMSEAGQSLPLLLASSVRALCCDRMGRRFDVIMKKMPQAVAFVDEGRGQCLINPTAADLLCLPGPGEYDTKKVANGMRQLADRSIVAADVYRCINMLAGKPSQTRDWIWELKHPRSVLRVRSYPISNVATHGRVWLFDDVTSEKDAHDAIEEANKAKSQFLAMMSHELRTPMTGVLGMLDLLRLTSLTEEQARFVRVMQGSAEGLMQVLNEILDFSKIQSGHLALENVNFYIDELLEQVSALFQGRLAERKLDLSIEMPSKSEMHVYGDPNRLRQVLSNLVSNAIKFTEEGGIRIRWKRVSSCGGLVTSDCFNDRDTCVSATSLPEGDEKNSTPFTHSNTDLTAPHVSLYDGDVGSEEQKVAAELQRRSSLLDPEVNLVVTHEATERRKAVEARIWFEVQVTDTGIGLTSEQQGRLFQSFSQADSSTTRKFGGTGLGLAICKGLVEVMGGKIWVESESGKGSTFAFRVPLSSAVGTSEMGLCTDSEFRQRAKSMPQPRSLKSKGQTLNVLVAEDNRVNQLLIRKMLVHYGHKVELVVNGQLAVEAIQIGQHDMILMDLQMPVLDGLSATKAIRALGGEVSKVPIYALTADVLTKGTGSLEAMGLTGYLTKPINWDKLSQVLDEVVQKKEEQRSWTPVNH